MNLLNRQFKNTYDELILYYPRYYRDVREMVAILNSQGQVADVLQDNIEQVYSNNFIDEMDEETIARMEAFLGISLNKQRTLEERRRLIKAFFVGFGRVSASMLEETIYAYTGAEAEITFERFDDEGNNRLNINIARGDMETLYMSDILLLLSIKIPAHIYYRADIWYNFPGIAVGGGRKRRTNYMHDYTLAGTLPDVSLHGAFNGIRVAVDRQKTAVKTEYEKAEENSMISGQAPNTSTLGASVAAGLNVKTEADSFTVSHDQAAEDAVTAGTEPVIAKAGVYSEISTAAEATVTAGGIDYIYCGETYASQS